MPQTRTFRGKVASCSDFDLTPSSLLPLEPYRDTLNIISNTDVRNAEAFTAREVGGDHFRSSATFLTQARPKQTEGSDVHVGISMRNAGMTNSPACLRTRWRTYVTMICGPCRLPTSSHA